MVRLPSTWVLAALPLGLQSQTASPEPVRTQAEGSTEQVVAGLSQDAVSITTDFTGSEILIYGAIRRDKPPPAVPPAPPRWPARPRSWPPAATASARS